MVAWSPQYVNDKELLESVQRRFTRMIPKLRDLLYAKRLDNLKLWTLEERCIHADLITTTTTTILRLFGFCPGQPG